MLFIFGNCLDESLRVFDNLQKHSENRKNQLLCQIGFIVGSCLVLLAAVVDEVFEEVVEIGQGL